NDNASSTNTRASPAGSRATVGSRACGMRSSSVERSTSASFSSVKVDTVLQRDGDASRSRNCASAPARQSFSAGHPSALSSAGRRQRIGPVVGHRQSTELSVQEGPKPLHLRRGGMRLCERRELTCQIDRRLQRGQGRTVLLIPVGGQLLQSAELAKILPPAQ